MPEIETLYDIFEIAARSGRPTFSSPATARSGDRSRRAISPSRSAPSPWA